MHAVAPLSAPRMARPAVSAGKDFIAALSRGVTLEIF